MSWPLHLVALTLFVNPLLNLLKIPATVRRTISGLLPWQWFSVLEFVRHGAV